MTVLMTMTKWTDSGNDDDNDDGNGAVENANVIVTMAGIGHVTPTKEQVDKRVNNEVTLAICEGRRTGIQEKREVATQE